MDQKIAFIKEALEVRRGGFKALCDVYKISRKTGYKWLARYRVAQSVTGLEERSRRPKKSPKRIKEGLEERILGLRKSDGWGARKITYLLCKEGVKVSVATVHRTLLRHGEVHRLDRHTPAPGRFERCEPNPSISAIWPAQTASVTGRHGGTVKMGNSVLIRFRDMYVREINLEKGSTLSFVHHTQELRCVDN